MKTRVITATVMVALMIPFFVFGNTFALPILLAFLSGMGAFELIRCEDIRKKSVVAVSCILIAAAMPFVARYTERSIENIFLCIFVLTVICFVVSLFNTKKYDIEKVGLAVSVTAYISYGFSCLALLRTTSTGEFDVYLPFIISWMTDTFAYFCGRAFGKHKLIPDVSPKKTVEGAIGGTACAVIITVLSCFAYSKIKGYSMNFIAVIVVSLVCSVLSQCGDLIMSLIKRRYGVKDYGRIFPGHGGVLDRFDSVILVSSVLYTFMYFIPYFRFFTILDF